jgi:hypothetical protein
MQPRDRWRDRHAEQKPEEGDDEDRAADPEEKQKSADAEDFAAIPLGDPGPTITRLPDSDASMPEPAALARLARLMLLVSQEGRKSL